MKISEEILWLAYKRIEDIPVLNKSMRGKKANLIGSIGEVLFEKFIQDQGLSLEKETGADMFNHDYVVEEKFRVDVKTKDRTVEPKQHYECSVNISKQEPDYYYFVSLLRDKDWDSFKEGFMLGAISHKTLYKEGELWTKGDVDTRNGLRIRQDCISVTISKLTGNDEFIEIMKGENGNSIK